MHGHIQVKPSFGLPSFYLYFYGENTVVFKNSGNIFKFSQPYIRMKGIISGTRKIIIEGSGFIWSPNQNFFVPITFSPGGGGVKRWIGKPKDRDEVEGVAFSVHPDTIKKFEESKEPRVDPKLKDGKNLARELFKIEGRWSDVCMIGDL